MTSSSKGSNLNDEENNELKTDFTGRCVLLCAGPAEQWLEGIVKMRVTYEQEAKLDG